ncbi:hypothetical protein JXA05_01720 [Candidatus Peregrinibacteria bacterium]|nr:hypothetical protein [Candidatus Peregrinibacteria bacterium]
MKKAIIPLLALFILLAVGYFALFSGSASFKQTLDPGVSVLKITHADSADFQIVVGGTDRITADLEGPADETKKARFFRSGGTAEFGFSEDWKQVSGTITVPQGTLLDISQSEKSGLTVRDGKGERKTGGAGSFLVDTVSASSITLGGGGATIIGWDDVVVWDPDTWDVFDLDEDDEGEGTENEISGNETPEAPDCSIGSQSIRNYCCSLQNTTVSHAECPGNWIFDNTLRGCRYRCDTVSPNQPPPSSPPADCSVGAQEVRDYCCAREHSGQQGGDCVGKWVFNNEILNCAYRCLTAEELEQYYHEDGADEPIDPISQLCSHSSTQEEQDRCCDDNLKNNLSIGPHPGFPDCIGKWHFEDNECQFQCATYEEMVQILGELRRQAEQNQE